MALSASDQGRVWQLELEVFLEAVGKTYPLVKVPHSWHPEKAPRTLSGVWHHLDILVRFLASVFCIGILPVTAKKA